MDSCDSQWDAEGERLAVLPAASSVVYLWTTADREVLKVEADPTNKASVAAATA